MTILSTMWLMPLFTFIYVNGILPIEATHHVYRNLQSLSSDDSFKQPYRTAYHFQPPKNWINDPNGPLSYKGLYHLFYQYNPKGAVWGNIVWAHSVSTDLVNWTPLDPAIFPSQPSDINGCWSGSATILHGNKPAILYTGIDPMNHQVQNIAYPKNLSDPFLREWIKSPKNPLMEPTSENKINASSFRDPTSGWLGKDGNWRIIIGSKRNTRGIAILYKSKDFINWIKSKHPLHSAKGTGMWECPDFFPVLKIGRFGVDTSLNSDDVRHVLKVSLDDKKHDYYLIGTYNDEKDKFVPDKGFEEENIEQILRYDYGKYYASKTFFDDGKNRRILLGWVNESSSVADDIKKGWSGIHTIPRTIWLHKSGKQLIQWPVVEVEKLRVNPVKWPTKILKGGELFPINGVTAAQADVEISFEVNNIREAEVLDKWTDPQILCSQKGTSVKSGLGPFGLLVFASKGLQEFTSVFFRIFIYQQKNLVLFCSDQSRSSLNKDNDMTTYGTFIDVDILHEKLSLRSLIDHSVVESFGGEGKACITSRVYPTLAINDKALIYAFNNGTTNVKITRLSAWSMKKAQLNGNL
ncbi:putative beta-fructofuranosidase [Medicago truncatula]|uniref:Acid beta-fructofuranosidase n=1 Tax=Medicago truncatula TaxID=3880 RepID=A0A072TLX8_MEDTR|nr:beta-fructofuranosidase, cell wall isozyme [Medicago truncatula]KEH18387.1 cell-wall invertase [Medicago truncatula]RHN39315.1 putative beta-fructofuranosidase [Medicago truncatula]